MFKVSVLVLQVSVDRACGVKRAFSCVCTAVMKPNTVRSGAEERRFSGARLDVLIFRLRSYHVLISYSAECSGRKFHKTLMF